MPCGASMSFRPFFTPCSTSYIGGPTYGVRPRFFLIRSRIFSYRGLVRRLVRWVARPPTVGLYDRPLSLTMMTSLRSLAAAMLFSASQAIPPVRPPSPISATTCRSSPRSR